MGTKVPRACEGQRGALELTQDILEKYCIKVISMERC